MNTVSLIPHNTTFSFLITQEMEKKRVDTYIASQFPLYSRSFFQRLIGEECVLINGQAITKTGTLLKKNDCVTVTFPSQPDNTQSGSSAPIELIHKNEHFLVVYKPANVLVHATKNYSSTPVLVDWLKHNYQEIGNIGYIDRPGIVHRLDKDTSGVLIIPRTQWAFSLFSKLFQERAIQKTYRALVVGHPDKQGTISFAIGRDPIKKIKMVVQNDRLAKKYPSATFRTAVTHYKVVQYFDTCSLVEIYPITGRTHQIRVHFSAIGHPIVGDNVYGTPSDIINRQALHAYGISFSFQGEEFSFTKDIPDDFAQAIALLSS